MEAGWPQGDKEKAFDRELKSWLIFHGAILVGELIPLTLSYIRANPASPLAPKFSFVLADEYQDLNKADQQLVDAFAREGMLTVIGDEDQSIYSFRFAHPEGISQFQIDHNGTHDEVLDVCRRCPKTIVSMANSLISKNRRSKKSLLKPFDSAPNGEVYLVQHNSENDEVKALAAFIDFYLKRDTNVKPGEILVLANRRIIGYAIRDELMAIGRQAVSFFQEQSLEEAIAIEGYAVLTLLATPTDGPALRAYLGLAKPDWWTNIYGRVRSAAIQESMSVFDFLEAVSIGNKPCPSYCQEMVNRFSVLHTRLDALKGKQLQELIDSLWPAASTECAEIRGLALIAMEKTNSVEELLGELRQLVTQPELPSADGDSIRIMSLHKSKGLTSRCAIIAGANAGVIPNIDPSLSGETLLRDLEEQRRLMYVSMTRATETLVISYTAKMSLKNAMKMKAMVTRNIGAEVLVQASPFLSELGKDAPTPISGATWSRNLGFLLAP
jgi:superfamily I DNA/RNA helicase